MSHRVAKALAAKRESKNMEFKESFDHKSTQDWCEIVKDLAAIANTGGGVVVFGLTSKGEPVDVDLSMLQDVDPARFYRSDVSLYGHFFGFQIQQAN